MTKLPAPPKSSFASDNVAGAHPLVLEAIAVANVGHVPAYGADPITARTEIAFKELFDHDVVTQFAYGGTGANVFALASMLRPADAIVCAAQSHINVDETGAPERALGTKLITVPTPDAKLRPSDLESVKSMFGNQHAPQPGIVAITQVTELGAVYSVEEIRSLSEAAHSMGMYVYLDGARIANATAALGGSRRQAAKRLHRTVGRDRAIKRVRPTPPPAPPKSPPITGEVVTEGPAQEPHAMRVSYRLPEAGHRLGFVARGADGVVWCLVALLPDDTRYFDRYPDGEEHRNPLGQRTVRRGFGLAVADVLQGTAEGTFQPLQ